MSCEFLKSIPPPGGGILFTSNKGLGYRAPALQVSFDVVLPPDQYQPFRASSFRRTWLSASNEFFVCWKRQMISTAEKSNSDFWLLLWIFLSCDVRSQNTSLVHYLISVAYVSLVSVVLISARSRNEDSPVILVCHQHCWCLESGK